MDLDSVTKLIVAVVTPAAAIIGVGGRKRRLRNDIRENLEIITQLHQDSVLREHTPAIGWLQGKVALDVARLAGQSLGTVRKKPIPWGSVVVAGVAASSLALLTWLICRDGFAWYAVFPATGAFLLVTAIAGMTMNREIPDDESALPPGATPIRTGTAQERMATSVAFAAAGGDTSRFNDEGVAGVALRFVGLMRAREYVAALDLADENWVLCRIQSWLYANHLPIGASEPEFEAMALALRDKRGPQSIWTEFVDTETEEFATTWADCDPDRLGVASRRRPIGDDMELVIMAPVGDTGGFFVTQPTVLQSALVFLMRRVDGEWRLASHVASAPPTPGRPPRWWISEADPIDAEQG